MNKLLNKLLFLLAVSTVAVTQVQAIDITKPLELRAEAEFGACDGKMMIAKRAKELGLDAIHDTVHEMAKDEARHGAAFAGLLKRYFNK